MDDVGSGPDLEMVMFSCMGELLDDVGCGPDLGMDDVGCGPNLEMGDVQLHG